MWSTEAIAHAANHMPINVAGAACRIRVGRSFFLVTSQTNATPEMVMLRAAILAPLATNPKFVSLEPGLSLLSFFTNNVQKKARTAISSKLMANVMYRMARRAARPS